MAKEISNRDKIIAQFGEVFKKTFDLDLEDYFYENFMFDVTILGHAIFKKHNIDRNTPISFNQVVIREYGSKAHELINAIIDFNFNNLSYQSVKKLSQLVIFLKI